MINSERDRPTQPAKNNSLSQCPAVFWHGRGTLTNIKSADACPQSGTRRVVAESSYSSNLRHTTPIKSV